MGRHLLPRTNSTVRLAATPAEGEILYDTDTDSLWVGDGITQGGLEMNPTLQDNEVTNAKLADMPEDTIKGRVSAGTGDPEDLTATQARTLLNVADGANNYSHPNHTGDVTSVGDGAQTIANDAVTNAKQANMAGNTVKGNPNSNVSDPQDMVAADVSTWNNPRGGDWLLGWRSNGVLAKMDVGNLPTGSGGEVNTASNIGDSGYGLYVQKIGVDMQFAKIAAPSSIIVVTFDAIGNTVDLDIADNKIGNEKLQDVAQDTLKGRVSTGVGDPEDLTATQARTLLNVADGANNYSHPNHTGDVTSVGDGAQTIAAGAVTNDKSANMAAWTLKGRNNASAGVPQDITASNVATDGSPVASADHLLGFDATGSFAKYLVGNIQGVTDPVGVGGNKTLALTDIGRPQAVTAAATITIPTNATAAFPIGTLIPIISETAGTVTITAATGVTLNGVTAGSKDIGEQYGGASLLKRALNTWVLTGNLA